MPVESPNFQFLTSYDPLLVRYARLAERYVLEDPNTTLIKLRQFAEALASEAAARVGTQVDSQVSFLDVLRLLQDRGLTTPEVGDLFHGIRRAGNDAAHKGFDNQREALHQLKMARQLGIWFHRTFGRQPSFKPGPFVPPPDEGRVQKEVAAELDRLRQAMAERDETLESIKATAEEEAARRGEAEERASKAYEDLETALEIAEETELKLTEEQARFEQRVAALTEQTAAEPGDALETYLEFATEASQALDLDEADTRRIIDGQLREAGWEVDSETLSWENGTRPQKGKHLVVSEWPVKGGRADYVLFSGLMPLAIVEAKRSAKDVPGVIQQAKRYSRDYVLSAAETPPGGPWEDFKVPFLFATNGRPYVPQIKTKSGVWFQDVRRSTNHPYALDSWYTPEGLLGELEKNTEAADERLRTDSSDYLPLRPYQHEAIRAVEKAISEGSREMLLAMATGTGKTRTCIGLIYRLIKAKRFRRVLFLVDRSALGTQATDAFKDVRLEQLQTFSDIYDMKELGDITPDPDTRLQVATVQSMVKRILYPSEDTPPVPVDAYDCIVVDESHRGYTLDREMSDAELSFRSERDYISKYRRVLEHFDAFKVGLTATPAIHTTEIFGKPVYEYGYRQAVVDGFLVDHEPPITITTALAEDGITWQQGEEAGFYDTRTGQLDLFEMPDELTMDVDKFNTRVITENFNRVVCEELAKHIDPTLPGKTLVFCATDNHADVVVNMLKEAFTQQYGSVDDEAVMKITGNSDRPQQLIRTYKNEAQPNVAVTVDLLTTGIDVPEIVNLVFIRRVRSRILYEQMLGRATRLCPDIGKEFFRVFDAVDIYSALEPFTSMHPVVPNPSITVGQLVEELAQADAEHMGGIQEQLIAKLQRKRRALDAEKSGEFQQLAGAELHELLDAFHDQTPEETLAWFHANPQVAEYLDALRGGSGGIVLVSDHEDEVTRVEHGYGGGKRPEDYLEGFRKFITDSDNQNRIPALLTVTQRPRDLTRKELQALRLELDRQGYTEANLRTAWRDTKNVDIAASIIGYIRQAALGSPLEPYENRVERALARILESRPWTQPQRKWLQRIGKQLKTETVVDREALDRGAFKSQGGFNRINKALDGQLEQVLADLNEELWRDAG